MRGSGEVVDFGGVKDYRSWGTKGGEKEENGSENGCTKLILRVKNKSSLPTAWS